MIQLVDLSIEAGNFRLEHISLFVPSGGYAVLMGKTGCGKTTLLEVICGLRRATRGRIMLDDRNVTSIRPAERGVGYVPQDGALFSTMTVAEHLSFALRVRRRPEAEIGARVRDLAAQLGIEGLLARYPAGLSGGEVQRVALGRALSFEPRILCLDEPLSALDHETRDSMRDLLAAVQRASGMTVLHVTHDVSEAEQLADHIIRLEHSAIIAREVDL